jgi:hypothetical protein
MALAPAPLPAIGEEHLDLVWAGGFDRNNPGAGITAIEQRVCILQGETIPVGQGKVRLVG